MPEVIDAASEDVLAALSRELANPGHNVVAFVGAGMSKQGGLPLWSELMRSLDQQVQELRPARADHARKAVLEHSDLLWQAELFRLELERSAAYERFLRRTFRKRLKEGAEVFRALVGLGFRHFVTTNYDTFIEQALAEGGVDFEELDWTDRQECRSFFLNHLLARQSPFVIHIHGRYDYPRSIVLSHRDYVARYVQSPEYVEKLSVLFATTRVVFIGFSLDDPDLRYVLRQVNSRFGTGDVQHFALMGLSHEEQVQIERDRLESQFGIAPIFYDAANGHAALRTVLSLERNHPPAQPNTFKTVVAPAASTAGASSASARPVVSWNDDPNKGSMGEHRPIRKERANWLLRISAESVRSIASSSRVRRQVIRRRSKVTLSSICIRRFPGLAWKCLPRTGGHRWRSPRTAHLPSESSVMAE